MNDVLGGLAPQAFLDRYWQREPLVVRQACPDLGDLIAPEELAGLALEPEVESRLVRGREGHRELLHGPFEEALFLSLPEADWTLLVQAVDLWVPEVAAVLDRFEFLPRWRIEDLMVSYATPGGGVGAHVDRYDVFLIQAAGQRRWRVGSGSELESSQTDEGGLQVLRHFAPENEWLLEPGDLLYLPPGYGHEGVAETAGMTFSVGFRAPLAVEMLDDLTTELMSQGQAAVYTDPPLTPSMARGEIDDVFVARVRALLGEILDDEALLGDWLARFMTAPKYAEHVGLTGEHRRAQFGGRTYVNGEIEDAD